MPTFTQNLRLTKPEYSEKASLDVLNGNYDILDEAVGELQPLTGRVENVERTANQAVLHIVDQYGNEQEKIGNTVKINISGGGSGAAESGAISIGLSLTADGETFHAFTEADNELIANITSDMIVAEAYIPNEMTHSDWTVTTGDKSITIDGEVLTDGVVQFVFVMNSENLLRTNEEWFATIEGRLSQIIANAVYPVGAVYFSVSSAEPSLLFGGTWESVEVPFDAVYAWKRTQ